MPTGLRKPSPSFSVSSYKIPYISVVGTKFSTESTIQPSNIKTFSAALTCETSQAEVVVGGTVARGQPDMAPSMDSKDPRTHRR